MSDSQALQRKVLTSLWRAGSAFIIPAIRHLVRDGPVKFAAKVLRRMRADEPLYSAILGHWRVMLVMSRPHTRVLARHHPQLLYRYVDGNLAQSFPKEWRRRILISHYQYLIDHVSVSFYDHILKDPPILWRSTIAGHIYVISLSFTGKQTFDGDLLLTLTQDDDELWQVAFTITPGQFVGSAAAHVMLVARIQGSRGKFAAIRYATKICCDIAPPHLLMAAAQGAAEALGVDVIAGLRNRELLWGGGDHGSTVRFDYDAFWRSFVSVENKGFYIIPVPAPEKPLAQITRAHRRRTQLKRQFKTEIAATVRDRLRTDFMKPNANIPNSPSQ